MVQLISKGGFRERANRSQKYKNSENLQTALRPRTYNCVAPLADDQPEYKDEKPENDAISEIENEG